MKNRFVNSRYDQIAGNRCRVVLPDGKKKEKDLIFVMEAPNPHINPGNAGGVNHAVNDHVV